MPRIKRNDQQKWSKKFNYEKIRIKKTASKISIECYYMMTSNSVVQLLREIAIILQKRKVTEYE